MPYRILALSGGGIRGVFQAEYLKLFADAFPQPRLPDRFELIAGTSTGAIVAAAVAFEPSMDRVLALFKEKGKAIFSPTSRWHNLFGLRRHLYSSETLKAELKKVFGARRFDDDEHGKLLICATKLHSSEKQLFTKAETPKVSVVDAILASCAAPYYFPCYTPEGMNPFVDGGLWANSPSLVAVQYAHHKFAVPPGEMRLISLGNSKPTDEIRFNADTYNGMYITTRIKSILDMMFHSQMELATTVAETFLNEGSVLDVNRKIRQEISVDDVGRALEELPIHASECFRETGAQFHDMTDSITSGPKESLVADIKRGLIRHGFDREFLKKGASKQSLEAGNYKHLSQIEKFLEGSREITYFRFVNDDPIPYLRTQVLNNLRDNSDVQGVNGKPVPGGSSDGRARKAFADNHVGKYFLLEPVDLHIAFVILKWGDGKQAAIVYPTPLNRRVCNLSESLVYESDEAVDFWDKQIFKKIFNTARAYCQDKNINPSTVFSELNHERKAADEPRS